MGEAVRRLVCLLLGHGEIVTLNDGRGAAWAQCRRCGKVTQAHSFHGGRPWEKS